MPPAMTAPLASATAQSEGSAPAAVVVGVVERVLLHKPESGYTVLRLSIAEEASLVVVVGVMPAAEPGDPGPGPPASRPCVVPWRCSRSAPAAARVPVVVPASRSRPSPTHRQEVPLP